jgi:peptide deformylase
VTGAPSEAVLDEMRAIMSAHGGIGLSAIQVGIAQRFFIVDKELADQNMIMDVLINPKIEAFIGDPELMNEGCLSIPGFFEDVRRYPQVSVSYDYDQKNAVRNQETFSGKLAHVIQHEYDHLDGRLFVDGLSAAKRSAILGNIQVLRRSGKLK